MGKPPSVYTASPACFVQLVHSSLIHQLHCQKHHRATRVLVHKQKWLVTAMPTTASAYFLRSEREWNADCQLLASLFSLRDAKIVLPQPLLTFHTVVHLRGDVTVWQLVFHCKLQTCSTDISSWWKSCSLHLLIYLWKCVSRLTAEFLVSFITIIWLVMYFREKSLVCFCSKDLLFCPDNTNFKTVIFSEKEKES